MWSRLACSFALLLLLAACATAPLSAALQRQTPAGIPRAALIADLPFFAQDAYQCGPAALATVLLHSKIEVTPEALAPLVYVPQRKGSFQIEMVAAARQYQRLVYTLEPTLSALLQEVAAGNPVLVLQNLALDMLPRWHFAVVKGYDLEARQLTLNSGRIENYRMPLTTFERTWARGGHWAQVVLAPPQLPATAQPTALFQALATLQETGQTNTAAEGFAAALQRWPDEAMLLMGSGNLHYSMGDKNSALAQFRRVTELQPDHAAAHNNAAQLLFERGEYSEALRHARQAVALGGAFAAAFQTTLDQILAAMD
jgi:tetratricopeptide (TPR) repeat protein